MNGILSIEGNAKSADIDANIDANIDKKFAKYIY